MGSDVMCRRLLLVVLSATCLGLVPGAARGAVADSDVPVLWVHGIVTSAGCPGLRTVKQAAPLRHVLRAIGRRRPVVPIDYLCGDSTGVSIRGAGGPSTTAYPKNGYNATTPIERLGLDLAWFIYDRYTLEGRSVDIAAHSMGGLIAAYAITHAGRPGFPPSLMVTDVVTFSTPFRGVDKTPAPMTPAQHSAVWCGPYRQCKQLIPGSAFLRGLARHRLPRSVDWTTLGGGPKDIVTFASSSAAVGADHRVNFFSTEPVAYGHTTMIRDTSTARDEPAYVTDGSAPRYRKNKGPHSVLWAALALTSSAW
jgi:hypothetical protein